MKDKIYIGIIVGLLIAFFISVSSCSTKNAALEIANQNIEALKDSTRTTKNLLGKTQFERKVFMGDIETLKKLNSDLTNELAAQRGDTRIITKIGTKIKIDTIYLQNYVNKSNDSTFTINFNYDKEYDSSNSIRIDGYTPIKAINDSSGIQVNSSSTVINSLDLRMKLYTGIKSVNGLYEVFARTDFPGVKFDLDGAIVDPEKSFLKEDKKMFSVVVGGGVGYGYANGTTGIFPTVGVFVGLNLIKF